jgi:hypothetical protein
VEDGEEFRFSAANPHGAKKAAAANTARNDPEHFKLRDKAVECARKRQERIVAAAELGVRGAICS